MLEDNKNNPTQSGDKKTSNNVAMGVIAYILFFVPLLTDAKDDPFVKYHIKQGLLVFLIGLGAFVLSPVLFFITWIVHLFVLVMIILGIVNVLNNKQEPLPLIGQYAEKFKF